jgi:hypothetical protein
MMHLFLATIQRKVSAQLPWVPGEARHGGRFLIMCPVREGGTPQFLLEVFEVEGSSPRGIP